MPAAQADANHPVEHQQVATADVLRVVAFPVAELRRLAAVAVRHVDRRAVQSAADCFRACLVAKRRAAADALNRRAVATADVEHQAVAHPPVAPVAVQLQVVVHRLDAVMDVRHQVAVAIVAVQAAADANLAAVQKVDYWLACSPANHRAAARPQAAVATADVRLAVVLQAVVLLLDVLADVQHQVAVHLRQDAAEVDVLNLHLSSKVLQ